MCRVFVVKGLIKFTHVAPAMLRLMIDAGETMPIQLLYHQGARVGILSAVQNAGPLVSGHRIDGIDPPLVNLQEQIDDSVHEGGHLGRE